MIKPPAFIDMALLSAPIEFEWRGSGAHAGSTSLTGPIGDLIDNKTTCATISLLSGIVQWALWRLHDHIDVTNALQLAEAMFAYEIDWRYVDRGPSLGIPPHQPPLESVLADMGWYMRMSINYKRDWDNQYQPIAETYHAAHVTNHILPAAAKKAFSKWLKTVTARLNKFAPKPEARKFEEFTSKDEYIQFCIPHRGDALPPDILDHHREYDHTKRKILVGEFLAGLDWKSNRYLRSPQAMKDLGFEGEPYKF